MTLFDTTELKRPTQRKLHAAWQEMAGAKVCMTETTAIELAPMAAAPTGGPNGLSAAEDELNRRGDAMTKRRRNELLQQAWWATMWRSEDAPFQLVELNEAQSEVCDRILERIDPRCFPGTGPEDYFDVGDPRIVVEAMATSSKVLLTSDLKTIDRCEVNRWAVENAGRFGLEPGPVVFDADATLLQWSETPVGHQLLLQAALLATWPSDDNMAALDMVERTQNQLEAMAAGPGRKLRGTADRIHNGFEYHPDPERLVESTRQLLPSATVESEWMVLKLEPKHAPRTRRFERRDATSITH